MNVFKICGKTKSDWAVLKVMSVALVEMTATLKCGGFDKLNHRVMQIYWTASYKFFFRSVGV